MIARALWMVVLCSLVSLGLGLLGAGITFLVQGEAISIALLKTYFLQFNGIMVGGFSFGLLFYIQSTEPQGINSLFNVLNIPEGHKYTLLKQRSWITSRFRKHAIAVLVTVFGGTILWNCGYPNQGFAKFFMAASSISMFYAAGLLSGYFFTSMLVFTKLDEISESVSLKPEAGTFELEKLNMNFLVSSTLATVTLYVAFRGTLTANFTYPYQGELFRALLIYPIVLFLPGILFTSFYYRYVLRKIQENDVILKINSIEKLSSEKAQEKVSIKEQLELQKLLLDVKRSLTEERRNNPLLTLKDSPALLVALIVLIQFVLLKDSTVNDFFMFLLNK